ncbi:hypothetical protein [Pseudomonas mangrovi]|uniref:Uncharacterized protein n=1 Tax=Pseudomonas mangrovi TaxID=2161748 RepID=A0A2T5P4Y6_9PSED|nr:hypothetical protein [Pseudomonas mangrovi]PTU72792.1 hypothetical protein DBO85_18755 [Pseudomonas mangrovi]
MHLSGEDAVLFISNLAPLYTLERVGNLTGARCLRDGTLILPVQVDEPLPAGESAWVKVWWQGDRLRESEHLAGLIASNALIEYVQLQSVGKPAAYTEALLDHLAQHYEFKTGEGLFLHTDPESPISKASERIKDYWPDAAWSLICKGLLG